MRPGARNGARGHRALVRTAVSAAAGGLAGAAVAFAAGGEIAAALLPEATGSSSGMVAAAVAVIAAALGSVAGAAGAVAVALRGVSGRGTTVTTVLVAGPPLSVLGVAVTFGLLDGLLPVMPDSRHAVLLAALLFLPSTALLGRWLASRRREDGAPER